MLCTAAVGLTRGRGVTDGCWLAKIIFFFPPHPFVFCMCPVILLQPFSVSLSPPPSLSPLALTAGVTKLCLTPGPELSLWWLFAQSWTRCTNRWMSRTGVRGQRECAMCGKYSKPVWNYSHTWNYIECLTDLWQFFFVCVCVHVFGWLATGFPEPHDKALFTLSPDHHNQHGLSSYSQLSHHAFQPYQLGGIPTGHLMKSDSGLMSGGPLWDMENFVGSYSGSSAHQPGSSQTGVTHKCSEFIFGIFM